MVDRGASIIFKENAWKSGLNMLFLRKMCGSQGLQYRQIPSKTSQGLKKGGITNYLKHSFHFENIQNNMVGKVR